MNDDTVGRYTPYVLAEKAHVVCSNCCKYAQMVWPREQNLNLPTFALCPNCGQFTQLGVDVIIAGDKSKSLLKILKEIREKEWQL